MPNTSTPMGLVPVSNAVGAPYSGSVRQYYHPAGDSIPIFVGDLVTATGDSTFVNSGGTIISLANVARSLPGNVFQGVCVGVLPDTSNSPIYAPAGIGVIVFVADDPYILCIAQDAPTGNQLTANDVGLNINITVGTGNTYTGMSGMLLDNNTKTTDANRDLKIIGQYLAPDNDLGSAVNIPAASGRYLVKVNRPRLANMTSGV